MALQYNYSTFVITVPQADLTLISGTIYELDTNQFRLDVLAEMDGAGIWAPDVFNHNTEVTVAGTTFARTIEMINGWSVEFEDGQYAVRLVGSNNNLFDVDNGVLIRNQVAVIPTNSAGLIAVNTAGTVAPTQQQIRDAMKLSHTEGDASVDTKLNNNLAVSAAAL